MSLDASGFTALHWICSPHKPISHQHQNLSFPTTNTITLQQPHGMKAITCPVPLTAPINGGLYANTAPHQSTLTLHISPPFFLLCTLRDWWAYLFYSMLTEWLARRFCYLFKQISPFEFFFSLFKNKPTHTHYVALLPTRNLYLHNIYIYICFVREHLLSVCVCVDFNNYPISPKIMFNYIYIINALYYLNTTNHFHIWKQREKKTQQTVPSHTWETILIKEKWDKLTKKKTHAIFIHFTNNFGCSRWRKS